MTIEDSRSVDSIVCAPGGGYDSVCTESDNIIAQYQGQVFSHVLFVPTASA